MTGTTVATPTLVASTVAIRATHPQLVHPAYDIQFTKALLMKTQSLLLEEEQTQKIDTPSSVCMELTIISSGVFEAVEYSAQHSTARHSVS